MTNTKHIEVDQVMTVRAFLTTVLRVVLPISEQWPTGYVQYLDEWHDFEVAEHLNRINGWKLTKFQIAGVRKRYFGNVHDPRNEAPAAPVPAAEPVIPVGHPDEGRITALELWMKTANTRFDAHEGRLDGHKHTIDETAAIVKKHTTEITAITDLQKKDHADIMALIGWATRCDTDWRKNQ